MSYKEPDPIIETASPGKGTSRFIFESREPYDAHRIHAAAIYCSDGRFGEHCDDFLQRYLQLPRYDRLVIPGGPGNLAGHFITYREGEALAQQLQFLIDAHGLERVVLIGHEGCAFYTDRLCITPADLMTRQHDDLRKTAERIKSMSAKLAVEGYMALRNEDRIVFEAIDVESAVRHRSATSTWI